MRRATGWGFDERRNLLIDRDAVALRVGAESFALPPAAIRDTPAGWCFDLDQLGQWLGVPIHADLPDSVLRIDTKDKIPTRA